MAALEKGNDKEVISKDSKATIEYLSGAVDAMRDRVAALDAREERIVKSASTATTYLKWSLGAWTLILLGALAVNTVSFFRAEEVIEEAKNEVRTLAGTTRPESVNWGRVEPGDPDLLVFYFSISRLEGGRARLIAEFLPKLEVTGAPAIVSGWRYTLHDEMLDWYTSSREFKSTNVSRAFGETESYRRAQAQFGSIIWTENNGQQIRLRLVPGAAWNGLILLSLTYGSCDEAVRAGDRLMALSEKDELGEVGITPVIENYSAIERKFDVEAIFFLDSEFECWPPDGEAPFDPVPEDRAPNIQEL
ncbi:hypothetical protein [Sulfitobacter sp.]|uniref:hypothetical protein n=1 Tax=Sulfitobacter sp. TaxID=1903071 RepID=UPI0025EEAF4D|nr:hypothetical protein [Sulfitobacter sp.]